MIATLIAKDLRAHAVVAGAALLAGAGIAVLLLFSAIGTEASSLLDAVRSAVLALAPLFAWLSVHRLFVLEQKEATIEVLAVLPIELSKIAAVKLGLALFATLGFAWVLLFGAAALVREIEYVDGAILSMAVLQLSAYVVCWWGLAAFAAQLGRYQISMLTVIAAWSMISEPLGISDQWKPFLGALDRPFHAALLETPWLGIGGGFFAGLIFAIGAGILFAWRAGALVRELFVRQQTSFNLLAFLILTAVMELIHLGEASAGREKASVEELSVIGRVVRAGGKSGGRITAAGERLEANLLQLEKELELEELGELVILPSFSPHRWIADTTGGFPLPAFTVDIRASDRDLDRELLRAVLEDRSIDDARPDRGWVTSGFATYWLTRARGPDPLEQRRAEYAALHLAPEAIDWPEVEALIGRELGAMVAWLGLEALAEKCGAQSVTAAARAQFGSARSRRVAARAIEDFAAGTEDDDPKCGLESAAVREAWSARLLSLARGSSAEARALPPPGTMRVLRTRHRDSFDLRLAPLREPGAVQLELWWSPIDPLYSRAANISPRHRPLRVVPIDQDTRRVTLPLDPRAHALATVAQWSEPLGLWITGPWEDVSTP